MNGMKKSIMVTSVFSLCFLTACSSSMTPHSGSKLDLDNHYVTQQDINQGVTSPVDIVPTDNFTVNGGYWAATLYGEENFPVLTGIIPPGWAIVDVNGAPKGSVGAIGTPQGVPDGELVPTALISIVEMDATSIEEAQQQGMTPFRNDSTEQWETRKISNPNDDSHSAVFHGKRTNSQGNTELIGSVEYAEWNGKIFGFSTVFNSPLKSTNTLWDNTNQMVFWSLRLR